MTGQSPITPAGAGFEFPFTQADFQTIAGIVYERSGIVLGAQKRDMAYARLTRRLRALGLRSFSEYCALLNGAGGAHEAGFLINAITTNLTKFFRETHHFEHLQSHALPQLASAAGGQKPHIRMWSAGCSSGEEPYSIAMTAMAAGREIGLEWDLRILASDLDTAMLQKAKAGVYSQASQADVPASIRERAFERPFSCNAGSVRVSKDVQSLVTFKQMNLLGPWPMSRHFDVIFCRNVMIYFDMKTKARLIQRFHSLLKEDGWLYVGHSESLLDHQSHFKLSGRTIYRKVSS